MNQLEYFCDNYNVDPLSIQKSCYRWAAKLFDAGDRKSDAVNCWIKAGDFAVAARYYLEKGDYEKAAPLFLSEDLYEKALDCYEKWGNGLEAVDLEGHVVTRFGIAACLAALQKEPAREKTMYFTACEFNKGVDTLNFQAACRCWEAFGVYGIYSGRIHLVQVGFEMALKCCADKNSDLQLRLLRRYRDAVKNNRLLYRQLDRRIIELAPEVAEPGDRR